MEENKEMKMPVPGSLIISSSPHLHDGATISGIMLQVLLCLLPAVVAAIWFFGLHALRVMALCVAFSMVFELEAVATRRMSALSSTAWMTAQSMVRKIAF